MTKEDSHTVRPYPAKRRSVQYGSTKHCKDKPQIPHSNREEITVSAFSTSTRRSSSTYKPVQTQDRKTIEKMAQQNGSAVAGKPRGGDSHGQVLTGKQEHCTTLLEVQNSWASTPTDCNADLKRELIAQQVKFEITELNSPTALQRFGAPFKSDFGEISPLDSELPILRYIFVHHVREFPFLDKAKEKEFWQDKLQVVSGVYPIVGEVTHIDLLAE